jgi:hypothetical protein
MGENINRSGEGLYVKKLSTKGVRSAYHIDGRLSWGHHGNTADVTSICKVWLPQSDLIPS